MKFNQGMYMYSDDPKVDLEGQGHRSKVKVTSPKKCYFRYHFNSCIMYCNLFIVKDHMGKCQRSAWSRSDVMWVKVSLEFLILAGGLTSTSSCFILRWVAYLCSLKELIFVGLFISWRWSKGTPVLLKILVIFQEVEKLLEERLKIREIDKCDENSHEVIGQLRDLTNRYRRVHLLSTAKRGR